MEDKGASEDSKEESPMGLEYDELVVFGIMMSPLSEEKGMEANDVTLMVNEDLEFQKEWHEESDNLVEEMISVKRMQWY